MTADKCMYWQGEGCIAHIYGVKCSKASNDLVAQCSATNDDLIEEADEYD